MNLIALLTLLSGSFELLRGSVPAYFWPLRYVGLAFIPGLTLLLVMKKRHTGILELFVLVTCLSPVFSGTTVLLLSHFGLAFKTSTDVAVVVFSAVSLVLLLKDRFKFSKADGNSGAVMLISILFSLVPAAILLLNPNLRIRDDSWFHAAITHEILDFGIPPTDPFFYGIKLLYFWFYHVYLGALCVSGGPSPFSVMAILNVHFFLAMACAAYLFSKNFVSGIRRYVSSLLLLFFGMNPLGAVFLLLGCSLGKTHGIDVFKELIFGGASTTLLGLCPRGYLHASLAFGMDKFLIGTAFSIGMVLSLAFLWKASSYLRSGALEDLFLAALCLLGAILFHTVAGLATFFVSAGALFLLIVFSRMRHAKVTPGRATFLLIASILPVLVSSPYLLSVMVGKGGGQIGGLDLNGAFLWSTALSGLLFWILAPRSISFLVGKRGGAFIALWMLGLLVFGFLVPLPFGNESKFISLLFVPLSIASGWFLYELFRGGFFRKLAGFCLVLSLIATNFLAIFAFLIDKGPERGGRAVFSHDERSAYEWISRYTRRDALFLDSEGRSELVVTGPRRLLWGGDSFAVGWGYSTPEMQKRKAVVTELFEEGRVSPGMIGFLGNFHTPVYVVWRKDDVGERLWQVPDGNAGLFTKVYENPLIKLYRLNL
ncbi:MAG: hypothetical protein QME66_09745 [Candidatus Eisenbacteria bacterium]|nr:hypothetical protein [Candidatus Eisenbacteria bacterium]